MGIKRDIEKYPIHSSEIKALLKKKFKKAYIECTDNKYYTCDLEVAKQIALLIPFRHIRKYKKEESDCEDFAWEFRYWSKLLFPRLPVLYIHCNTSKGRHSLNGIIYKNIAGRITFTYIEPQSGLLRYYNYRPYMIVC